jgi:hypothetical protein
MTYPRRRAPETADVVATNPRASATIGFNQALWRQFQGRSSFGAQYWSNNAFWFTDEAGATFRTDSWLKPLDQLMRMFSGTAIDDTRMPPAGWLFGTVRFPLDHVAARKASGVEEDKIRFFVRAYHVEAADDLVPLMTDPSYGGDLLFLVAPRDSGRGPMSEPWSSQVALTADDSQALPYEVKRFDGNNLVVEVVNPLATAVWMSYADVWHPLWTATVNGRPAPVYRASMAYKAVALDGGPNTVHFEFGSPLFAVLSMVVSANSAFWLCAVGWMIADLCRPRVSTPDSRSA